MTNDYGNLELHKVLLSAMKDIDKICRENGLKYYLYAGTLLGAINHKGFIPWDDDIDLVMFPDDYKVFERIVLSEYGDRYAIATFDATTDWYSKMNKLLVNGTTIHSIHGESKQPIFIDISLLHGVPDNKYLRLIHRKKIKFINLVLAVKSGAVIPTSLKSKLVLGNLSRLSKRFWGSLLDKTMCQYDGENTEYVGILCNTLTRNPYTGHSGYETDITKRSWHLRTIDVLFEDELLMTITCPEKDLDKRYGPHWSEPYPEEKRVTKHDVKSYEISEEVRKRVGI